MYNKTDQRMKIAEIDTGKLHFVSIISRGGSQSFKLLNKRIVL